jgi:hypothetical protein
MSGPKATLVILAGLGMGLFGLYLAWSGYRDHRTLERRGEPATAQVVSVDFSTRGPDEMEVVFLDANGARHQAEVERSSGASVGDTVEIVYDPEHPTNAEEVEGSHQFPSPRVWWGQLFWLLAGV